MSFFGLEQISKVSFKFTEFMHAVMVALLYYHIYADQMLHSDQSTVAVSDSLGCLSLVELCQSGPRLVNRWKAHQFEAWIVCCGGGGGSDQHTLYSGGDDCRLCQWDIREGLTKPTFTSKR